MYEHYARIRAYGIGARSVFGGDGNQGKRRGQKSGKEERARIRWGKTETLEAEKPVRPLKPRVE